MACPRHVGLLDRPVGMSERHVGLLHGRVGLSDRWVGMSKRHVSLLDRRVSMSDRLVGLLNRQVGESEACWSTGQAGWREGKFYGALSVALSCSLSHLL